MHPGCMPKKVPERHSHKRSPGSSQLLSWQSISLKAKYCSARKYTTLRYLLLNRQTKFCMLVPTWMVATTIMNYFRYTSETQVLLFIKNNNKKQNQTKPHKTNQQKPHKTNKKPSPNFNISSATTDLFFHLKNHSISKIICIPCAEKCYENKINL